MALLKVRCVTKRFGSQRVLDDVALDAAAGEVLGVVGHNGAGKSTLLGTLCGLVRADMGEGTVAGVPMGDRMALRGRVQLVPEQPPLYPDLTAAEYVEFFARAAGIPLREARRSSIERLKEVGLVDAAGRRMGTFSKGMAQRASLARALANQPPVLLLDEPESGLDPLARLDLKAIVRTVAARGVTVVVATHDLDAVASTCDRMVVLRHGRVVHRQELCRDAEHRRLRLRVASKADEARRILEMAPHVSAFWVRGNRINLDLSAGSDAAQVLESIVKGGVPVLEFGPRDNDIEAAYRRHAGGIG